MFRLPCILASSWKLFNSVFFCSETVEVGKLKINANMENMEYNKTINPINNIKVFRLKSVINTLDSWP